MKYKSPYTPKSLPRATQRQLEIERRQQQELDRELARRNPGGCRCCD